jgi:RNA-dependent RNA polymerase
MTCARIRDWMGDFSHIKVVAKCAARLGLCFSTTRGISGKVQIIPIEDVERIDQSGYMRCFTDGVGKISKVLAARIADELGLPPSSEPSAFQFRMGGCKGLLAVSLDAKGQQVHIRRSQSKFNAIYNGLEIIRCSSFSTASLNRQTITILSSLGVPDEVFNSMLTTQLSDYHSAMTDRTKALDLLRGLVDDNHITLTIVSMILNGFMDTREPFFQTVLHLWRTWSIKLLKEKAKIIVRDGAFLLGCTDETGTLRGHITSSKRFGDPNRLDQLPQIFVQVPDRMKSGSYVVIEGICIVGRNPSLHPGDIRIVQAVDVPALHHLRDVVVFSQLGDRDIPSMCSGGDLDGDDFFVIWDPELCPKEWNCTPMEYDPPKPVTLDRTVEIADMMKFFVRYMKNDALPTIALAHLALSDALDMGVKDPKCEKTQLLSI